MGRISFGDLVEKVEEIATKPIMCSSCGGALTNPGLIQIDPSKGKFFLCEFCGTMNIIPKGLMPGADVSEFMLGRLTGTAKPITEDTLLAVIDVSGSMSGGKLTAVKESLIRTVTDLGVNQPDTTFGLIAFTTDVMIYDEEMKEVLRISGDTKYSVKEITKKVEKALSKIKFKPLKKTRKKWVESIEKLHSARNTALGPAMVAAYVIMKKRGGRVILLTDGLANEGVGRLEGGSSQEGAKLYETLAAQAANASIIIDVVGIKDPSAFMALEALAIMSMETGGTMWYADTSDLASALSSSSREKIVARGVRLRVITPKGVEVAEVSGLGSPSPKAVREGIRLGSVTADREVYVRLAPKRKMKVDEIPIQLQVSYTDQDGQQRMRVFTQRVKVTEKAEEIIETMDAELPTTFAVQRAGEEQYRGDVRRSQEILEETQRAMRAAGASAPPALAKAMKRADRVLTREREEAEEVAVRQKAESARRAPMRAKQVAAIADQDAAESMQRARSSSRRLFKEEEEE